VNTQEVSAGVFEARRGTYWITTDPARFDLEVIHEYLRRSYWAAGIPRETVERSIRHSLGFGLFEWERQIGFARVVTDRATFGYLADVFILESHRGRGLAPWFMEVVLAHPDLQGLRRFGLVTRDAHGLYAKAGFRPLGAPERHMEIVRVNAYTQEVSS
jgi:N-acetylglutamate synthase-like GNAT family acetyltransferase